MKWSNHKRNANFTLAWLLSSSVSHFGLGFWSICSIKPFRSFTKNCSVLSDSSQPGQHISNPRLPTAASQTKASSRAGYYRRRSSSLTASFLQLHSTFHADSDACYSLAAHPLCTKLHSLLTAISPPEPTAVVKLTELSVTNNALYSPKQALDELSTLCSLCFSTEHSLEFMLQILTQDQQNLHHILQAFSHF